MRSAATGSSSNMACRLSAQLAATALSIKCNDLHLGARVLISDDAAHVLGLPGNTIQIRRLMIRSETSLSNNSMTIATSPVREYQKTLHTLLKQINLNALPFVRVRPPAVEY